MRRVASDWADRFGGDGRGLVVAIVVGIVLFALPLVLDVPDLVDLTVYAIMATLALSLAFVWGYAGILSLGQSAFFGLGGYVYAIAVINIGESTVPIALGIVLPMVFAALLGYFMFWGRIGDVYLAVITLTVSLIFFHVINSTSSGQYRIGKAAVGGYDGIPGLPPINLPGDPSEALGYEANYMIAVALALLAYFGLRWLLATRFGRVVVAIRENEQRAELLGFDARRYKLAAYVIGAGIAGAAGVLFANWQNVVSPTMFSIVFTAQIIVWVMVGGLGTLVGPIIGAVLVQHLVIWIGRTKIADANIILGLLFIVFVLLVPAGIVPTIRRWIAARRATQRTRTSAPAPQAPT